MFSFSKRKKRSAAGAANTPVTPKAMLGAAVNAADGFRVEQLGPLEVAVLANIGRPTPAPPAAPTPTHPAK